MSKLWLYHKEKEPLIIDESEQEEFEKKGWVDSPAKFIDIKDFGVDPENSMMVQQLGETIEGIKDMANGALNLDSMKDKELKAYAFDNFGKKIKGRRDKLISQVDALIKTDE